MTPGKMALQLVDEHLAGIPLSSGVRVSILSRLIEDLTVWRASAVAEALAEERQARALPGQPITPERFAAISNLLPGNPVYHWEQYAKNLQTAVGDLLRHATFLEGLLADLGSDRPTALQDWSRGRDAGLEEAANLLDPPAELSDLGLAHARRHFADAIRALKSSQKEP